MKFYTVFYSFQDRPYLISFHDMAPAERWANIIHKANGVESQIIRTTEYFTSGMVHKFTDIIG